MTDITTATVRKDGRTLDQLRPITIERGWSSHAEGSALISFGGTKVLCTASFTNGVFLSGAQPIERFVAVIDQQISVAQREGREGLAPHQVYAVLSDRHHAEALRRAKPSSPSPMVTSL